MTKICFPERFDRDTLGPFFEELDKNLNTPDICIDCTTLKYSNPTAMLVAGSKLREWINCRRARNISTRKTGHEKESNVHSYLRHLGFFEFITMGGGKKVGEAKGSATYLPITKISKPKFDATTQETAEWYDDIKAAVRGLARVVSGTAEDTEENRLYNYALREIIRNVFEHSEAEECFVCGQRLLNGQVEIAVVDEGIGIANSLQRSFKTKNDVDALRMAIKPGVSSTTNININHNIYNNSGFGLYILSEISSSFGWFVLGSGSSRIVGYKEEIIEEPLNFAGTYFGMQLNRHPSQFSNLLKDIIYSGEVEAEANGIMAKASSISKMAF